ncbi:MAG: hypothetical protein AABY93_14245 [Bacteroidota bacterium]
MNQKIKLIEALEEILGSSESNLSLEDRGKIREVIEGLKKANNKEELVKALGPIASLLQITIKTIVEIFSG